MLTLPAGVVTAKNKKSNRPITLIRIDLPINGSNPAITLRLADRGSAADARVFNTGTLDWYDILTDVGTINHLSDALTGFEASTPSIRLTVLNLPTDLFTPAAPFSSIFRNYKPETATVTISQWFEGEGLTEADIVDLFVGRLSAPVEISETDCSFDVVDVELDYSQRTLGKLITLDDYPDAPDDSLGKFAPIVIGQVDRAPGLRVKKVRETTIASVLLKTDTVLNVTSTEGFAASGTLIIDGDEIAYTSKGPTTFHGLSGIDAIHYQGDLVIEKVTDHRFLFSDPGFPVQSIANLRARGFLIDSALYSIDLPNGEAVFSERPKVVVSIDSQFLQARFDSVDASNNALNPSNALDPTQRTTFATISQANPTLALKQTDAMPNIGEITRVLLRVEHFEEGLLPNDSLTVDIVGIGQVGALSKPAAEDAVTGGASGGSVDITHQHIEDVGVSLDLAHQHNVVLDPGFVDHSPTGGTGNDIPFNSNQVGQTHNITYTNQTGDSAFYTFTVNGDITGGGFPDAFTVKIQATGEIIYRVEYQAGVGKVVTINKTSATVAGSPGSSLTLVVDSSNIGGGSNDLLIDLGGFDRRTYTTSDGSTDSALSGSEATRTGGVDQYSDSPSLTGVTDPEKSSMSVVDLIDITGHIAGDWGNFTDQVVQVKYNGSSDGRSSWIINVVYEIEYTFQSVEYTDEITAEVAGVIDDGSGTITGTPSALIERPDHVFAWSILGGLGLASSAIDSASFAAAGAQYDALIAPGYRFAGVVTRETALRDLWTAWGLQARSLIYFAGGQARLRVKPRNGDPLIPDKTLTDAEILFEGQSSLHLERTRAASIINAIDLRYNLDRSTDAWRGVTSASDADSITAYGKRTDPDRFEFDWVREGQMAADLAAFYVAELREPYIYAGFTAFLDQLEVERFDVLGLTHALIDGDASRVIPGIVLGVDRQLGLGSGSKMDLITFSLRLANDPAGLFDFTPGLFDDHAGLFDDA